MLGLGKIEVQLDKDYKYPKQKLQFNLQEIESFESERIEPQKKPNLDIIMSYGSREDGSREDDSQLIGDYSSRRKAAIEYLVPDSSDS